MKTKITVDTLPQEAKETLNDILQQEPCDTLHNLLTIQNHIIQYGYEQINRELSDAMHTLSLFAKFIRDAETIEPNCTGQGCKKISEA